MSRRLLITGAGGFLGRALVRQALAELSRPAEEAPS